MEIYQGKTKELIKDGAVWRLRFKDNILGRAGIADSGGNEVIGSKPGLGAANFVIAAWTCKLMAAAGIPTHFCGLTDDSIEVTPAVQIPLEVVVRNRATGSFLKRYQGRAKSGQELPALIELTLKDDKLDDPLITPEAVVALGLATASEVATIIALSRSINETVCADTDVRGLQVYDFKIEFGRRLDDNVVIAIDVLSGNSMRIARDGEFLSPLELAAAVAES